MNRKSVFEWHKRFKEGRESVRDDERCGRSKEFRTPELIGQIKNFMDQDRCVSIEAISAHVDVSVGTVHTIIHKELKMWKICGKFVQRVLREDQKERRCHDSRKMVELINSDPAVLGDLVTCNESWIYCYDPETKKQSSQWKHAGSPRPKKARQSKSSHKLLMIPFLSWFDNECQKAIRLQRAALKRFQKQPTTPNLIEYKLNRALAHRVIKAVKKECWQKYVSRLNSSSKPKAIWEMIWKIAGKHQATPIKHLSKNNFVINDKKNIANLLAETFSQNSSSQNCKPKFITVKQNTKMYKLNFKSKTRNNTITCFH